MEGGERQKNVLLLKRERIEGGGKRPVDLLLVSLRRNDFKRREENRKSQFFLFIEEN